MNIIQYNEEMRDLKKELNKNDLICRSELLRILGIKAAQLRYLYESRRIKKEDFVQYGHQTLYKRSDILKIKEILFRMM